MMVYGMPWLHKKCNISCRSEIQPCIPRTTGRQKHRSNVLVNTISSYWKGSRYPPFLDHVINELSEQLVNPSLDSKRNFS